MRRASELSRPSSVCPSSVTCARPTARVCVSRSPPGSSRDQAGCLHLRACSSSDLSDKRVLSSCTQRDCPAAEALRGYDPHSHFRGGACTLRPHRGYHSVPEALEGADGCCPVNVFGLGARSACGESPIWSDTTPSGSKLAHLLMQRPSTPCRTPACQFGTVVPSRPGCAPFCRSKLARLNLALADDALCYIRRWASTRERSS